MKIIYNNVGCIKNGEIFIERNKLNIKYGINGTGKSTISKGILAKVNDEKIILDELVPHGSDEIPEVIIDEDFESAILFNQDYINSQLFNEDITSNTFEIVINTTEYRLAVDKINKHFKKLSDEISSDGLKKTHEKLTSFINSIKFNNNGKISGHSKLGKAKNIPDLTTNLHDMSKPYIRYLQDNDNSEWFDWFNRGIKFIKDKSLSKCPLCNSDLNANIDYISKEINSIATKPNLKADFEMKAIYRQIENVINDYRKQTFNNVLNSGIEPTNNELRELKELREKVESEKKKIDNLFSLDVNIIEKKFNENLLIDFLEENKLDLAFFNQLDQTVFNNIESVNIKIDEIIRSNKDIKDLIKEFSEYLNSLISDKKQYINDFLSISGIPYCIDIIAEGEKNYKTILKPVNGDTIVSDRPLSYGEKNTISLILFSLEAASKDFIILDDPVSSFDNNKKFAIFHYLFTKDKAVFRDKTVLLLSHDFDVIVDFNFKYELSAYKPNICILKNMNHVLKEEKLSDKKIVSTVKEWKRKAKANQNNFLIRIVNLRKYYEYMDRKDKVVFNILSSLEHRDPEPMNSKKESLLSNVGVEKIADANEKIKEIIPDFDYDKYIKEIDDDSKLKEWYKSTKSNVEKIQIMRVYLHKNKHIYDENKVFINFLTESYHVENNNLKMITESKFDSIPYYIIKMCDEIMGIKE